MASQHFRAGVVVVVRHPDGQQFLAFERCDAPGQWQFPQGGIQLDETPITAAWRELAEETGLDQRHVTMVGEHPEWLAYEWPDDVKALKQATDKQLVTKSKGVRLGQTQRWFVFDAVEATVEPMPDGHEFRAWRWATKEWILDAVVDFRRPNYQRVLGTL